ncbi:MAG: M67 family metallopeptidase [bacterium]|nr:M67 family metallopeptidase [bacterium]
MKPPGAPAEIAIAAPVIGEIRRHAEAEAPLEACGLLAGNGNLVTRAFGMRNARVSARRFSLDPEEQLAVMKRARGEGLEIIAAYHSHPRGRARPSREDIRLAFDPDLVHVIIALAPRPDLRAFRIDGGDVEEVRLAVAAGAAAGPR